MRALYKNMNWKQRLLKLIESVTSKDVQKAFDPEDPEEIAKRTAAIQIKKAIKRYGGIQRSTRR